MKRIITLAILTTMVWGCSKKTTPAKTPEPPVVTTPAATDTLAKVADIEAGKAIYIAKCGRCHELPKTEEYTTARWPKLVNRMAPKAKLDEQQTQNVLAYVLANAKKD